MGDIGFSPIGGPAANVGSADPHATNGRAASVCDVGQIKTMLGADARAATVGRREMKVIIGYRVCVTDMVDPQP